MTSEAPTACFLSFGQLKHQLLCLLSLLIDINPMLLLLLLHYHGIGWLGGSVVAAQECDRSDQYIGPQTKAATHQ